MTRHATTRFTAGQWNLLHVLVTSRAEDRPVVASSRTRGGPRPSAASATGDRLVLLGLARWSMPGSRYLLVTPLGLTLAECADRETAVEMLRSEASPVAAYV